MSRDGGPRVLPRGATVLFGFVVLLCVAQIAWWTYYQVREADRSERTALALLAAESLAACARIERTHELAAFPHHAALEEWLEASGLPLALSHEETPGSVALGVWAPAAAADLGEVWIGPRPEARARVLSRARSRVRMFLAEGIAMTLAILGGVMILVAALRRELRLREAQERFLAGAAHELKTPLATLRLGLQSLAAGRAEPERASRYVQGMLEQVERLHRRVEDLLAAAEVGSRGPPRLEEGDLSREVAEVVREMEPRFAEAGIRLDAERLHPLRARFDAEGIRTVARNLLDNAVKYSPRGATVEVGLARRGDEAVLEVADEGIGVAPDEIPSLFSRFYRCRSPEAQRRGGAGLGLYLVREIVASHGGSVGCRSEGEGRGSRFFVRLPVAAGGGTA